MAIPREGDDERLKILAFALSAMVPISGRHGYSCFDHGCRLGPDAKNQVDRTQEGTLQLGNHLIAAWSRVQPRIALSSGEAELYGWECAGFLKLWVGFVRQMRE